MTVQKRGFVFILAGFQSLLYFCTPRSIILYPLFCGPSFISRALLFSHSLFFLSASLALSPSYIVTSSPPLFFLFFFFFLFTVFILYCTVTVTPGLGAHKQPAHPTPTSNHLPRTKPPSLFLLPSFLPLPSPLLSSAPPLYPTGLEIVPLFLTSVLLGD